MLHQFEEKDFGMLFGDMLPWMRNMVVQGAYFDHKGETPGLGANIKQRYFMDDFIGEHLLDEAGDFKGIQSS